MLESVSSVEEKDMEERVFYRGKGYTLLWTSGDGMRCLVAKVPYRRGYTRMIWVDASLIRRKHESGKSQRPKP